MTREYIMFTDNAQEAFSKMQEKAVMSDRKTKFGFAQVCHMINPPKTDKRYAVFKLIED